MTGKNDSGANEGTLRQRGLSVRAKLVAIVAAMILLAGGAAAFTLYQVAQNRDAVAYQGETLERLRTVSKLDRAFNKMRYWHLDMVTSLKEEPRAKAKAALSATKEHLDALEGFAPDVATQLRSHANAFHERTMTALDHYMFQEREAGNQALADGRSNVQKAAKLLDALVARHVEPVETARERAATAADTALTAAIVLMFVVVLAGAAAGLLIYASAVRPLARLTQAVGWLTNGDLRASIPHTRRPDEIGKLARALDLFRGKAEQVQTYSDRQEASERQAAERSEALRALSQELDASVTTALDDIEMSVGQLAISSDSLGDIARQNEARARDTASFARQSLDNAETAAEAAQAMRRSIDEIAQRASETAETTREVRSVADTTSTQVKSLESAASNISEIVTMIQEIAEKTNLLALNATIEAARAGEAGKGFAVVANEVKSLANQTAKATENITTHVETVQAETNNAVEAVGRIARMLDSVDQSAAAITSAVEEQQTSVGDITQNMQDVKAGGEQLQHNIEEIHGTAETTRSESDRVITAVEQLYQRTSAVRESVGDVTARIRAA